MMSPDPGALSLGAAFLAGLAASGHCLGMCGGIAGALADPRIRIFRGTDLVAENDNWGGDPLVAAAGRAVGLLRGALLGGFGHVGLGLFQGHGAELFDGLAGLDVLVGLAGFHVERAGEAIDFDDLVGVEFRGFGLVVHL
jgi:hypothetical protein